MMSYTDEEARPLVSESGPRSRRAAAPTTMSMQQQQQQQQNVYSSNSNEDFSKKVGPNRHRLLSSVIGPCQTCTSSVASVCCARPQQQADPNVTYYEDTFNDESWECTFGTADQDGIWVNCSDNVGQIMATTVWVLISYSVLTVTLLASHQKLSRSIAMFYGTVCALALASHAKTMFTDPGSIPAEAVPRAVLFKQGITTHSMCSHCQVYKPPNSHHCRICNRCISRMDHHCPWMNNCVGASNFKHFILFLCYTWIGCAFALIIFACNYFFCRSEDCAFDVVLVQLVRVMTLLCIFTLLFVSSMIMNVTYGIMTGVGTIDRLKKKSSSTFIESDEEPIPLKDIFGIQGYWTWILPMDPIFEDYDRVMGYSQPQRLLREKQRDDFHGTTV